MRIIGAGRSNGIFRFIWELRHCYYYLTLCNVLSIYEEKNTQVSKEDVKLNEL